MDEDLLMKKIMTSGLLLGLLIVASISAQGAVFTFIPEPADFDDFDHYQAFTWGIEWDPSNPPIVAATLTFKNIGDWYPETNDIFYTRMLNEAPLGVTAYGDYENEGDYFAGQGTLIRTWSDPDDGTFPNDLTISFDDALLANLNNYASDGLFALAFDPDCHYFNDGVKLTLFSDVPEPTTILLFGLGTLGLTAIRKRRK
jgi:hypothetical protein